MISRFIQITGLLFLFQGNLSAQVFDVVNLFNNGANDKRINFVYMGDGYTSTQQDTFISDATNASNEQFNYTPYKEYKNFFNAYAIKVISNEEGTDHPGTATDVTEPVFPVTEADTYFNTTFDYYNIHRLLVPTNYEAINDVLSENTPYYDQANIIVNNPNYGGSGGAYATASTDSQSNLIMIHEIGHSFVDLADEYWAGEYYADEKANMTQESDPTLVKWKNWLGDEDIDIYPYGSSSPESDWYRPHQSCIMKQLSGVFCAVCREATIDKIYELVSPIENHFPEESTVTFDGTDLDFSVDLIYPNPNTLSIEWFLDENSINTTDTNITLTDSDLENESHTVNVTVIDNTGLSRSFLPANGYVFGYTWNIDNTLDATEETYKILYSIYPNPTQDVLNINYFSRNITEAFDLLITDIQGKVIIRKSLLMEDGNHFITLNVNSIKSGIYIVNIKSLHYNKSYKFIKK